MTGRVAVEPKLRCMLLRTETRTFQLIGPLAGDLAPGVSVQVTGTVDYGAVPPCGSAVPLRIIRIRPTP